MIWPLGNTKTLIGCGSDDGDDDGAAKKMKAEKSQAYPRVRVKSPSQGSSKGCGGKTPNQKPSTLALNGGFFRDL